MLKSLHGISTFHGNVLTDVRLAKQAGFDSIEIFYPKFTRYLENGGTIQKLKTIISDADLSISFLSALDRIERHEGSERQNLLSEAKKITTEAVELGTDTVMILPRTGIDHFSDEKIMDIMTDNIDAISAIGEKYGVRYMIELPAFTKFRTIKQAHEIIRRVNRSNIGVVVDFWHFYASGATPDDVAKMNKDHIFGVHFCDGRIPHKPEDTWDETILRDCFPGEGEIDLKAWSNAVKATGYDGAWSIELISSRLWEDDMFDLTKSLISTMKKYI